MSPEKVAAITNRVNQVGLSVGIHFKSGSKIGSTREAHRLIHLSLIKSPEVQNTLVNKLFEAYHEQEKDISSHDVLRRIATNTGIDGEEVDDWLNSNVGRDIVNAEGLKNRERVNSGDTPG
jgi:predicted DsbA family dithiol-disulfide isomerase